MRSLLGLEPRRCGALVLLLLAVACASAGQGSAQEPIPYPVQVVPLIGHPGGMKAVPSDDGDLLVSEGSDGAAARQSARFGSRRESFAIGRRLAP